MEIPLSVVPFINIGIVVWIALALFTGYKKGFLWEILKTLGYLAAAVLSWIVSPGLAETINIFPKAWAPFAGTSVGELVYTRINYVVWFIIVFLVIVILLALLKPLFGAVTELPVLKNLNGILGALFSLLTTFILMLVVVYILNTALIKNGKDVIDQSFLKYIQMAGTGLLAFVRDSFSENVAIQKLLSDPLSLTDEDMGTIISWFKNAKLTREQVVDFLQKYGFDYEKINQYMENFGN